MDYTIAISKRRRHQKVEYLARLMYRDNETGARKEKSKTAPSMSEAKRCLKDLENEFQIGGQRTVESEHMTFPELVKHCKETRYCEAQFDNDGRKIIGVRGKDTIEAQIKALEDYFGSIRLRDIQVANLRAYRKHRLFCKNRRGEMLSVATVNRELSTMRAMLNEALVNDWILTNPFKKVRSGELISIADERRRETILSVEEEKALLAACSGDLRRHLKALVVAALDTGARQGELLKLRWSDIDFEEGVIKNVTSYKGKTVQRREVPLTGRLRAVLLDLKAKPGVAAYRRSPITGNKPDSSLVFSIASNVQNSWREARKDANLEHIRFHDLRHTAATRLAQKMQLALVGQVLGHSDPKTTNRYVNRTRQVINEAAIILDSWQQQEPPIIEGKAVN
ncbi:MAG TPA: tyrosine-type recombinase/integrase [Pyrinomonadaceae bacterium]|nr:tyrosine-type recombinase/integrase [Pyrinomonadaceae bacterium]